MRAFKLSLILSFGFFAQMGFASFTPIVDELVETNLAVVQGDSSIDGFVQLNRTQLSISLLVKDVNYFFPKAEVTTDDCDAVIYSATLMLEHLTKVTVVDNTSYNYERCPSLAPFPEAVVRLQSQGSDSIEDDYTGAHFSAVQY